MSKIRLNIWSTYHYAPLDDGDGGDDGNGADDDDNDDDDDDDQSPRADASYSLRQNGYSATLDHLCPFNQKPDGH